MDADKMTEWIVAGVATTFFAIMLGAATWYVSTHQADALPEAVPVSPARSPGSAGVRTANLFVPISGVTKKDGAPGANSLYSEQNGVISYGVEGFPRKQVLGADVATFAVSNSWETYAKDAEHVYVEGAVIPGADPKTFVPLCGLSVDRDSSCGYGKDARHVYAYTRVLPGADPRTFVSLVSNNKTNLADAGKGWVPSAIDANAYYAAYYPTNRADMSSDVTGTRLTTLADGTTLHFSNTANVIAYNVNNAHWAGYINDLKIGNRSYSGGTYLVDGSRVYTVYSECTLDATGHAAECTPKISHVDEVGDRPAGL